MLILGYENADALHGIARILGESSFSLLYIGFDIFM